MKCDEARDLVSPWLDGELDQAQRVEVEGHLEACGQCRGYFGEMGAQEGILRALADLPLPATDAGRAARSWHVEAVRPPERESRLRYFRRYVAVPAFAAAAAAAAVLFLHTGGGRDDLTYRPLSADQQRILEAAAPAVALKYRVGVIVTDLNNLPPSPSTTESLDRLRAQIVEEDFLDAVAAVKAEAARKGDMDSFRLYTQLEMVLLGIVNGDPASVEMARSVRL